VLSLDEYENPAKLDVEAFWASARKDVDAFLAALGLGETRDWTMLEIGCGLGRMTHHFAQYFRKVYALDVSPTMLERARCYWGHVPTIEWVLGNGEDLHQLGTAGIDFAFSFMTLQHVPGPTTVLRYIRETSRVFTQGGVACLQFRVLPEGMSLPGVTYYLATRWSPLLIGGLRRAWDLIHRHNRTRAHFASKYESWRGCVLRPSAIEATAAAANLQVKNAVYIGRQYRYYVLQKPVRSRQEAV
jgi:ubiquinone/menaquinone biosynthesis C-methylase UbiE